MSFLEKLSEEFKKFDELDEEVETYSVMSPVYGPRILSSEFQIIPYHVLVFCLEYYPPMNLSQIRVKKYEDISRKLYGYFKHDIYRKLFLIFKNVWINDFSLLKYFPSKMKSMLLYPTTWQSINHPLPKDIEKFVFSINTNKLNETMENQSTPTVGNQALNNILPQNSFKNVKLNLVVDHGDFFDFKKLVDFLPSKLEKFCLHYCLDEVPASDLYSKSFKFLEFKNKFKNIRKIRLSLQNVTKQIDLSNIVMQPELMEHFELDGNFKIVGTFSIFKYLKKLKLKGLTFQFGIELTHPKFTFHQELFPFKTIQFICFRFVVNIGYFLSVVLPSKKNEFIKLERFQIIQYYSDSYCETHGLKKNEFLNSLPSSIVNLKLFGYKQELKDEDFTSEFNQNHKKLGKLELGYNLKLNGSCFLNFPEFIEEYDFSNCRGIKDEWILKLPISRLRHFNFENSSISWSVSYILKHGKNLETLKLMRCEKLIDDYFFNEYKNEKEIVEESKNISLFENTKKLQELRLGASKLTDKVLISVPKTIETFHITGCKFTQTGFLSLPKKLRFLILHRLDFFSNDILNIFLEDKFHVKYLEQLTVGNCKYLSRKDELIFSKKKKKALKFFTFGNKDKDLTPTLKKKI